MVGSETIDIGTVGNGRDFGPVDHRESAGNTQIIVSKQSLLMADDLVFMMGKFEALIPGDRLYSENHMWLQEDGDGFRVGFTSYSVRLLQDVFFLDWNVDANSPVRLKQEIGEIESLKAISSLFAPVEGNLNSFNEELLDDPSKINVDNHGDGWLFHMATSATLLSPEEYIKVLEAGWEKTQQHLKGQLN